MARSLSIVLFLVKLSCWEVANSPFTNPLPSMLRTIPNGALLSTAEAMVISSKIPANHVVSDVGDAANLRLSFNTNDRAFFEFGFNIQAVEGTE